MPTKGINVERMLCKKTYTTMMTSRTASIRVFMTLCVDASRNVFTLIICSSTRPSGSSSRTSSATLFIFSIISFALDPAVCITMNVELG